VEVATEEAVVGRASRGLQVGSDGKFWNVFSAFWAILEFRNVLGNSGTFSETLGMFSGIWPILADFGRFQRFKLECLGVTSFGIFRNIQVENREFGIKL